MPGIRMTKRDVVLTARVQKQLAVALREAARQNHRTISGEICAMLAERFAVRGMEINR
jgi:hypothetical protein